MITVTFLLKNANLCKYDYMITNQVNFNDVINTVLGNHMGECRAKIAIGKLLNLKNVL